MVENSTQTPNKPVRSPSKRKLPDTSPYETRSKKKKVNISEICSKSKLLIDEKISTSQKRSHQDSETSFVSTTDEDEQDKDSNVDNLIQQLSDLIRSCGKEDHTSKESSLPKASKQSISDSVGSGSCTKTNRSKRKSQEPQKTRRKLDLATDDKISEMPNNQSVDSSTENCSDGEANLIIANPKKTRRKANSADSTHIPDEVMDFIVKSSIDDKLQSIAQKEKLTETHVKNIIKQVITDKSVLAMLRNSIYGIDFADPNGIPMYEPKLTRAKTKELYEQQMKVVAGDDPFTWGGNSCTAEIEPTATHALVTQEFPEEEDDDEYQPELDEQIPSDEESMLSGFGSPSTIASKSSHLIHTLTPSSTCSVTPKNASTPIACVKTLKTTEAEFRTVQRTLNFSKEEPSLICSRTRSKYPMTDTPLEYLEMAFKPPDITADMYETEIDDEEWKKFLLDFSQPQDTTKANDDDEQVDPEYNLIADAEEEDPSFEELREELRGDRAVRISKKEVNQLLMEFLDSFDIMDDDTENKSRSRTSICQQLKESATSADDWSGSQKMYDLSNTIILPDDTQIISQPQSENYYLANLAPELPAAANLTQEQEPLELEPITVTFMLPQFSKEQLDVLGCQIVQHVQLLTQSVLLTSYSEKLNFIETGAKQMLREIDIAGNLSCHQGPSLFHQFNLKFALDTVAQYDAKKEEFDKSKHVLKEGHWARYGYNEGTRSKYWRVIPYKFPRIIQGLFMESSALPYLNLLPVGLFHEDYYRNRRGYLYSEYILLAVAFSEVVSDLSIFKINHLRINSPFPLALTKACVEVVKQNRIHTKVTILNRHIRNLLLRHSLEGEHKYNPLVHYAMTGIVDLPQARVPGNARRVLGPLKNVPLRFLPFIFNQMVRRYWKAQKCKNIAPPVHSITPKDAPAVAPSNIIIIQNGSCTQIILPNSYTTVPQTFSLKEPESIRILPQQPEASDFNHSSPTPSSSSPSFTIQRKPINTVIPTPIPMAISSCETSIPSCGAPEKNGDIQKDTNPAVPHHTPPQPSVNSPPTQVFESTTAEPILPNILQLPSPQREEGTYSGSAACSPKSIGVNEEVGSSPPSSPVLSPSHHPSTSEIPSRVSSTSKLSPFFGMTDTPDTPLLDMPYLLGTPYIAQESPESKNSSPRFKGTPLGRSNIYSSPSLMQPSPWTSLDTDPSLPTPILDERLPRTPHESEELSYTWNLSLNSNSSSSFECPSPSLIDQQDEPEPKKDSKDQIKNVAFMCAEEDPGPVSFSKVMMDPDSKKDMAPKRALTENLKQGKENSRCSPHETTRMGHPNRLHERKSKPRASKRLTACKQVDAMATTEANKSKKIEDFVKTRRKNLSRSTIVGNKEKEVGVRNTKEKRFSEGEEKYSSEELQEAERNSIVTVNSEEINDTEVSRLEQGSEREDFKLDNEKSVQENENVSANKISIEEEELSETLELNFFKRVKENLAKEDPSKFIEFISILKPLKNRRDSPQVVYLQVLKILEPFPDLQLQFLVLLNPEQAKAVGKYPEYCVIQFIKKVFDEFKGASHDPVYQSNLITELSLLLLKEGIPKEQLPYFLKPIISLEPNVLDLLPGQNPLEFKTLMGDAKETSQVKTEPLSPEADNWPSREISVFPFRNSSEKNLKQGKEDSSSSVQEITRIGRPIRSHELRSSHIPVCRHRASKQVSTCSQVDTMAVTEDNKRNEFGDFVKTRGSKRLTRSTKVGNKQKEFDVKFTKKNKCTEQEDEYNSSEEFQEAERNSIVTVNNEEKVSRIQHESERENFKFDAERSVQENENASANKFTIDREEELIETLELNFFKRVKENLAKEDPSKFIEFISILKPLKNHRDSPQVVYLQVLKILEQFPDLQLQFLVLLNPEQAKAVGKYPEYCVIQFIKKVFEEFEGASHDPVYQSKLITELGLLLQNEGIPKEQLAYFLKPIISLEPDVLDLLPGETPLDYSILMDDTNESSPMKTEPLSPEPDMREISETPLINSLEENLSEGKEDSSSSPEKTSRMGQPKRLHELKSSYIPVSAHRASKRIATSSQMDTMAVTESNKNKKIGDFVKTRRRKSLTKSTSVGNKRKESTIKITKKKGCKEGEEKYLSEELQEAERNSIVIVNREEINDTEVSRLQHESERENFEFDKEKSVQENENASDNKISMEEEEELIETLELNFFKRVKENLAKEDPSKFIEFISILKPLKNHRNSPQVVYLEVLKILEKFPDLQLQFLVLLNPEQAKAIGKYPEYCVMQFIKKLFEEFEEASHDPVYQSKLITELSLLLQKEGIPKEQLAYFLNPIISLEPNILDLLPGQSRLDYAIPLDDTNENSPMKIEPLSPEPHLTEISLTPLGNSLEETLREGKVYSNSSPQETTRRGQPNRSHELKSSHIPVSWHRASKWVTTCSQVDTIAITEKNKKIGDFVKTRGRKSLMKSTSVVNKRKESTIKITKKKGCKEGEEKYLSEELQEAERNSIVTVNREEINDTEVSRLQHESERENFEFDKEKSVQENENASDNKISMEEEEELIETLELNFFKRVKENLAKEDPSKFIEFISILKPLKNHRDSPHVVYLQVLKILEQFPDLQLQFLVLLNPEQAKAVGKYPEYCVIQFIKKIFEEFKGNSHDPVYQSKLITELSLLLQKEGIPKEQLAYFLKPIISVEPDVLDSLPGQSPLDYVILMNDTNESSPMKTEPLSPEPDNWASREISVTPLRNSLEVSSYQSSPVKETSGNTDWPFPKVSSSAIIEESLYSQKNETCGNDSKCRASCVNCDVICTQIQHSYESFSLSQNSEENDEMESSDSFSSMKIEPESISSLRTLENISQSMDRINVKGKNNRASSKAYLSAEKSGKTNDADCSKRNKERKQFDYIKLNQKETIKTRSSERKEDKLNCQAFSPESLAWTKKEDEFLINYVRTNRKLTTSFYRMAIKSLPTKTKEQIRERLIFILDILSPS